MSSKLETKLYHYLCKAVSDYKMIKPGDRVMACLSGGKDSYTMVKLLAKLRTAWHYKFDLFIYTLDQAQPGWKDDAMRAWLDTLKIPYKIEREDTYSIVTDKIPEGKTYCSLCSRLRRGIIYNRAEEWGYNKVALGHHRDDLITTLMMSICYGGRIQSMPPKLLSDNKKHIVIRPLTYCQEKDIKAFAIEEKFPIIPCNLCGSQDNLARQRIKKVIDELATQNPKVPSNMLHALQSLQPSQLMDKNWHDFNFELEPTKPSIPD